MPLIQMSELATLKKASEVKAVADEALYIQEEMAVAACINSAANTGAHEAVWQRPMSARLKTTLEGLGYKVVEAPHAADSGRLYTIKGF